MLFSQRKNLKPLAKIIQIESVDDELRSSLWSLLSICYWDGWKSGYAQYGDQHSAAIESLCHQFWFSYFKRPLDTMPEFRESHGQSCYTIFREYVFKCKWNEFYDFMEFVIKNTPDTLSSPFIKMANDVLERENSGYRIIGTEVSDITSKDEVAEVDEAAQNPHKAVSTHINTAIGFLSDRKSPDYRNSIKESISAVESLVKIITQEDNATLAGGLKKLKEKFDIHPALEKGFLSIYGYTSDAKGIRHALLDEAKVDHADAKFMLVACSTFINFVTEKTK